jgi:hypothetical protein
VVAGILNSRCCRRAASDTSRISSGLGPFLLWLPPSVSAVENRRTSISESLRRLSDAGIPDTGAWQTLRESADYEAGSHTEGHAGERAGAPVVPPSHVGLAHAADSATRARADDL